MKFSLNKISLSALVAATSLGGKVANADNVCFTSKTELKTAIESYTASSTVDKYGQIGDWCTGQVTDMSTLFEGKNTFNEDISKWDVSRVTNFQAMFKFAFAFNQNISGWNVSKGVNFNEMLGAAHAFNQDLPWDVSSATSMHGMLGGLKVFNGDVSGWDVSRVTTMQSMFVESLVFNRDISGWDVSSVNSMYSMFAQSLSFNQDISGWDVSRVTGMGSMFAEAISFNRDISRWDVSRVTDLSATFYSARAFNQNLCPWQAKLPTSFHTSMLFEGSACPYKVQPSKTSQYFCQDCSVTPSPTSSPTTKSPTPSPTSSPTVTPGWEIAYKDMEADFSSNSTQELKFFYNVSSTRDFKVDIYQEDCSTTIEGDAFVLTKNKTSPLGDGKHSLELWYDVNKTTITKSSIWNATADQFRLCQVLKLVAGNLTISQDEHIFTIGFNMTADFSFDNGLEGALTGTDSESTNLDDYVKACKCTGNEPFVCDANPLAPSEELHVCIQSTSSDVQISDVTSMIIEQGNERLSVVNDRQIVYSSFSSKNEISEENGYMINVLLPINLFNFSGPNVTVEGTLQMQLGGGRRGLRKLLSGNTEAAPFNLEIALTDTKVVAEMKDAAEEGTAPPSYLVPVLAAVGSVSLLAMAGMAVAFRKRGARGSVAV